MFKDRLKEVRIEQKLTQKDMYEMLELSSNGYASYEQGRTEPNLQTLKKICEILHVSADYLFGLENDDGSKNY